MTKPQRHGFSRRVSEYVRDRRTVNVLIMLTDLREKHSALNIDQANRVLRDSNFVAAGAGVWERLDNPAGV